MASKISPVILNSKKTSGTNFVKRLIYIFIYIYHHRYYYYRKCFGKTNKVLQEKNRTTSQAVANNSIDTIFHPETLKTVKKNIGVKKKQEVPSKFVKKTSSLNLAKAPDQVP